MSSNTANQQQPPPPTATGGKSVAPISQQPGAASALSKLPQPPAYATANNNNSANINNNNNINGIRTDVDPNRIYTVPARQGTQGVECELSYTSLKAVGNGSFGVVFQATVLDKEGRPSELVAIKKVLQDRRFKNRELQIMRSLAHINIVGLRYFFYSTGSAHGGHVTTSLSQANTNEEVFLNLVLEFVPETIYKSCRYYAKLKQQMPPLLVKLYMYQVFRSLAYIHSLGICHRDIKPQNLLLDPRTGVVKLCDFGSAKQLVKGEPNVAYICSRYYRAPELIFGATDYTPAIDVWSSGCVMAEMILGTPLFPGESGVDQLVEIIKILGTPTKEQIKSMNPNYTEFKFPSIKPHAWSKVLRVKTSSNSAQPSSAATPQDGVVAFMPKILDYTPTARLTSIEAIADPFFDELRLQETRLPTGQPLPKLFNFTEHELSIRPDLLGRLVPAWFADDLLKMTGVDVGNFKPVPITVRGLNDAP